MTNSINTKVRLNEIPEELKILKQWVAWKATPRDNGKVGKLPINPHTKKAAKPNDPSTWGSFEDAVSCYQDSNLNGICFIFTKEDPYVGIDFDDCFIDETLSPEIEGLVQRIGSYTEISPSGKGLHIIIKGELPESGKNGKAMEIYDRDHSFTFTGNRLPSTPAEILDKSQILDDLLKEYFPEAVPLNSDTAILKTAFAKPNGNKIDALLNGHYQQFGYKSQSEADLALCQLLLRQADGNIITVDRLFRKSQLYRAKWDVVHSGDGKTYGEKTLEKAYSSFRIQSDHPKTISFPCTDLGNAERLAHHYSDQLKYCHPWSKWVVWDGVKWSEDATGKINQLAKKTVRKIYDEAKQMQDDDKRRAIAKHAISSESNGRIKSMVSLAQSELPVRPEIFDQNRFLLNCKNGTIDLSTGKLNPHDKNNFITKVAPVVYDPSATCPQWEKFLNRIMDNNQDLIRFLQQAIGYSLTGDVSEQCFFIFWGAGSNGKTTFIRAISNILGDYSQHTPIDTLTIKTKGAASNDVARLKGSRFVTAAESEKGNRLAENLIKQLTGDDTISARFLYQETFEFEAEHKIFLATNNKPIIAGNDHAIWRRIRLIPFQVTITEEEKDRRLPEKLKAEYSGILNWAIKGCLEWQQNPDGLGIPAEVLQATKEYRNEMDSLNNFIKECCIERQDLNVPSKNMYHAYAKYCEENAEYQLKQASFGRKLKEKGFVRKPLGDERTRCWVGLNLTERMGLG